jgi:hypothetical protein
MIADPDIDGLEDENGECGRRGEAENNDTAKPEKKGFAVRATAKVKKIGWKRITAAIGA